MELFDFINDASYDKKDVFSELTEREEKRYPGYLVNRYFSFLPDTIMSANEMNKWSHLDNKLKHHFYLHGLRKRKRFVKWIKPEEVEHIELVQRAFACSERRAKEYLTLLHPNDIESLKTTYHHLNEDNH